MTDSLPDPDDIEIVQMMAAQSVVKDHHDQLHREYIEQIRDYCERYGVEVPDKVERELLGMKADTTTTPECNVDGCTTSSAYLLPPEGDLCESCAVERHPKTVGMIRQALGRPPAAERADDA